MKQLSLITLLSFILLGLLSCSAEKTPKSTSSAFWKAVQEKNMEQAKALSTWDSVEYLKYLDADNFHPERFELGEEKVTPSTAEVPVMLFTTKQGKSGIKVPGVTVLLKTEQGWRVDVKKTLGTVVKRTVDNVFDQLNNVLQDSLKEIDKSLSKSLNDFGKALEEGTKELRKELNKPIVPPSHKLPMTAPPKGQQI